LSKSKAELERFTLELPNPISPRVQQPPIISWEEQLHDHNQKIEEYLQNLLFRGCTYESTIKSSKAVLNHLFDRLQIEDPNHPRGRRQILVWELLDPGLGSSRLGSLITLLLQDNLAHGTRRKYMGELRSFCDYVLAKPNIPGSSELTIIEKYGPITLTFTKYDLPMHAQDRPTKPRYALSPALRPLLTLLQLTPTLKMNRMTSSTFLSIRTLRNGEKTNAHYLEIARSFEGAWCQSRI